MAGSTPYYGLAFFDFSDELDAPLNVQKEISRFMVVDKQLYGLYSVFGAGVINGWTVTDNGTTEANGISVAVSPGIGIIRFLATESEFPATIDALPPNSIVHIHAVLTGTTAQDRGVTFAWNTASALGDNTLLLARVQTGQNSIVAIDNTVRSLIGFKQIIKEEIDAHKHRGTPSKIDLRTETKNQLPGARIDSLDASQITIGSFSIEQLPFIDHNDLLHDGMLTHAGLDSFVKTLEQSNKELLGETATVNLMRLILAEKYNSANVDQYFVNEIALIPGISDNDLIDFDATTAYVNLAGNCISGIPPSSGEFVDIEWDNQTSLANAHRKTNITVTGGAATLTRDDEATEVIADFEQAGGQGVAIPTFELSSEIILDDAELLAEASDTLKTGGFFSGKFSAQRQFRMMFTKTFSSSRDWDSFDELVVNIKTLSSSHGSVYCYFIDDSTGVEKSSGNFLLLSENEVTSNTDITKNDFAERTFSIAAKGRSSVTKFVIFTDDTSSEFEFYVDDVFVRTRSLFQEQGTIVFRYSSPSALTFHSVFYESAVPDSTSVQVRIRTANSASLLNRAAYSFFLKNGDAVALPGTDAEIEVTLSTTDRTVTPTLDSVKLRLLVDSETHGFDVDTSSDWALGTTQNIEIMQTSGTLSSLILPDPINVDGLSFSHLQSVREIDDSDVAVFGFSGVNLPIAANQALTWATEPLKRFDEPVSAVRQVDKSFIVCDYENDRVLRVDSAGNLVKGFGSVNNSDSSFYPMVSVFNADTDILTIVLSQSIDRSSVDLNDISVKLGATEIELSADLDTIIDSDKSNQILEIQLSADKALQVEATSNPVTVDFKTGAFPQGIAQSSNASALIGINGLPVFIGDFTYMDSIRGPIFADILDNGNWIVANSAIDYGGKAATASDDVLSADLTSATVAVGATQSVALSGGTEPYSIQSSGDATVATAALSGSALTITGVGSGTTTVIIQDSTATAQTVSISVAVGVAATEAAAVTYPSILEFSPSTQESVFTSNLIRFSQFSLGGIYEQRSDRIIVAGIRPDGATLSAADNEGSTETEGDSESLNDAAAFRSAAIEALDGFRGTVGIIDKTSNNLIFTYTSPDGLYASDVDVNEDGFLVVAESAFADAAGRVVVLDGSGNITRVIGNGTFNAVNDAKALTGDHILVST